MDLPKDLLTFLQSEINRIETMAGTLAVIEREHHQRLSGYEETALKEMAVEEESAARRLGMIKQMCLAMGERLEGLKSVGMEEDVIERAEGRAGNAPFH